jgi:hypothetical protein
MRWRGGSIFWCQYSFHCSFWWHVIIPPTIRTILNVGTSINVSDFGLIIIAIGKSLLLCMSRGSSSWHVVFWLWMTCSIYNVQNGIRIILQFVGGNVDASAVGSKFCHQSCLFITDLQIGLYTKCCSILENHMWQPKQSTFSILRDTVDYWWEVAEGESGGIGGTLAGRLKILNFWPFVRKLAFNAPFLPFYCDIWEKMI